MITKDYKLQTIKSYLSLKRFDDKSTEKMIRYIVEVIEEQNDKIEKIDDEIKNSLKRDKTCEQK